MDINAHHFDTLLSTEAGVFIRKVWRPGRDLNPGHSGDSRIYWAELYYQGVSEGGIAFPRTVFIGIKTSIYKFLAMTARRAFLSISKISRELLTDPAA